MFLPRYSLRWLLAITVVCALAFSVVALALRGMSWAVGVSAAIVAVVIALAVYGLVFGLIDAVSAFVPSQEIEVAVYEPSPEAPQPSDSSRAPTRATGPAERPADPDSGTVPDSSNEKP